MKKPARVYVYCSAKNRQFYWRLLAPNYRVIADGAEGYSTRTGAKRGAERVIAYLRAGVMFA